MQIRQSFRYSLPVFCEDVKKEGHRFRKYVGLFHSETLDSNKKRVLEALTSSEESDTLCLVIATSSLGCGVDMKEVRKVIHFGPAYHLTDFCQQIGRAGRNTNDQCLAKLYIFPESGNLISRSMKSYNGSANQSCLRVALFTPFNDEDVPVVPVVPGHQCCSYCLSVCECGSEEFHVKKDSTEIVSSPELSQIRDVSKSDEETFVDILLELQECYTKGPVLAPTRVISGITQTLIKRIVSHLPYIDSVLYIKNNFNLGMKLANDIGIAINKLFGNSDVGESFGDIVETNDCDSDIDMEIGERELNDETFNYSDFTFSTDESLSSLSDSDY